MVGLIAIIILVLGGISKGFMDLSAEGKLSEWGNLFNKKLSWRNKWKFTKRNGFEFTNNWKQNWWYLGLYKPEYQEKFPFSSTILVFTTDFWHLSQFFFLNSILLGAYLFEPIAGNQIYDFLIICACLKIPFELTHHITKKYLK